MATRNQILKHTLLPGLIPRITALLGSGFVHLAYMMALIYGNIRLLPRGHPYLLPENIGRYGIRHVIAEAANNLVFSRKNIDQILIFFTILVGLVLLALQFILLVTAVIAEQPAYAIGVLSAQDLFNNPVGGNAATGALGPSQDIAFIILDRVFGIGPVGGVFSPGLAPGGVPNLFNSCISDTGVLCEDLDGDPTGNTPTIYPFPFHLALHRMLQFYSMGIFWVGASVLIYFMIAVVAETAQTGTPFGQRFNKAWVPVRIILFFALILPVHTGTKFITSTDSNAGLNGAQLITFYIVKMGSNFATNGWAYFNTGGVVAPPGAPPIPSANSANYLSQQRSIVAQPNIPEVNDLIQAVHVIQTCKQAYILQGHAESNIQAYLVRPPLPQGITTPINGPPLTPDAILLNTANYTQAKDFNYQGNIVIRFGRLATQRPNLSGAPELQEHYAFLKGNVKPLCGDITIQIQGTSQPGADTIFQGYYNMLIVLLNDQGIIDRAECRAAQTVETAKAPATCTILPDNAWYISKIDQYKNIVRGAVINGLDAQTAGGIFNMPNNIMERGWAGASVWYNRIADMNGAVTTATLNIPKISKIPLLMDIAASSNSRENKYVNAKKLYNQNMAEALGVNVLFDIEPNERKILTAMVITHKGWTANGSARASNFDKPSGNIVIDFINGVLGTSGLFEMRKNTDVHPLAQLSTLGKGMMEATMRNAAYGAILGGVGGIANKADFGFTDAMAKSASKFFFTMTLVSMGIASVLYYVLPFLPFIYFMFAVSGWVKSIFEAIVAMPLWALAHLRIDGEGMPGPGASNGYFLLLEIFLRPILIIFGFVASISIFSALVDVLNQIFDLVVANAGGYDNEFEVQGGTIPGEPGIVNFISKISFSRGPVDQFFFTAMYAIICYLIGLASFKLVDLIPNNILRWMGISVSTFQENAGDPASKLSSQVFRGTTLAGNQVSGNIQGDLALMTKFD